MCRAVFEIPTPAGVPAGVPAVEKVEKRRGRKGKQAAVATPTPPSVSASSLPVNLFASSALVTTTVSSSSSAKVNPNDIKCEICEDGEEEDATSFCVPCAMYFCAGCQRAHKKPRTTAGHEFVSVDKALKGKMKASVVYCERHPQQETNTYCHTDKQNICPECILDFHEGHQVERLANVVQGFKDEIMQLVDKVFLVSFLH